MFRVRRLQAVAGAVYGFVVFVLPGTVGCAVDSASDDDVRELKRDVWVDPTSDFALSYDNVDAVTTGLIGSVVKVGNISSGTFERNCSGTLIANTDTEAFVLTAAHCGQNGASKAVRADAGVFYQQNGTMLYGPSVATENDRWGAGDERVGANDIAVIRLPVPILADAASVAPVYLGSSQRNGLNFHQGGGNPNNISTVATFVGYGPHCLTFSNGCSSNAESGVRFIVSGYAYNWFDPCQGDLPLCTNTAVIAISSSVSRSGVSPGDSGGPLFNDGFVVGVTSLATDFNPFGFRGSVWAPVSTNLGNARWLASWLSREADFTAEEVGLYGVDSVYIHDRAHVDATVAGPDLEIGADAMIDGDLFTETFFIRDRGGFTGTLQYYTGQFQNMIGDIGPQESWLPQFPTDVANSDVNLCRGNLFAQQFTGPTGWTNYDPPNSGTVTVALAPGQYGHVRAKRDVILQLEPGSYHFRSLDLDHASILAKLGTEPTYIYVEDLLDIKGRTSSSAHGPTSKIFIGTNSDRPIHLHGADQNSSVQDFQATIVAPNAKIEVHNFYDFEGQIIAKEVELHQDAEFTYRAFGGEFCPL